MLPPPPDAVPPPALTPELKQLLIDSLEGQERARYLALASLSALLYDMFLTFGDEVRPGTVAVESCRLRPC